ncbi:unnamed protein product [Toxocara canis]|uniref:Secreted protein n=1 Tax=Toxocara canis TaxID=6265 RepID=A0A183TZV2_TOXCA|nr:unnamed protein product [Toxocara canis]
MCVCVLNFARTVTSSLPATAYRISDQLSEFCERLLGTGDVSSLQLEPPLLCGVILVVGSFGADIGGAGHQKW